MVTVGMEALMYRQSEKITALYCRLALYSGEMDVSAAKNQMDRLSEYAEAHRLYNPRFFCDWGFSGTNDNRPEYQRMLREIEAGNVSDLVVSSFSRLSRSYMDCNKLIEDILPRYGVTFHSVKDQIVHTPEKLEALAAESKDFRARLLRQWQEGGRK